MLKVKELRTKSLDELKLELTKSRRELFKLRLWLKSKVDDSLQTSDLKKARRYVAKILTVMQELGSIRA